MDSRIVPEAGDRRLFPPQIVVEVKALACELPSQRQLPFSRLSHADIAKEAVERGIVASISGATVWRWLSADAIKPWTYRSWISPRDPQFPDKAGRVLDLYHGLWDKRPLGADDYVICADEKPSIQALRRPAPTTAPTAHRPAHVEFEYHRRGTLAYLAAWDVHRAKLFGRTEETTGVRPFRHLVDIVMRQQPYRSARRVFWITDNGSSHRGNVSIERLAQWYPNAILVHTPVHASWLNQIEIYFSVLQRKALTPNDLPDLNALRARLLNFQDHYQSIAQPFQWKFTRDDLRRLLAKLDNPSAHDQRLAA